MKSFLKMLSLIFLLCTAMTCDEEFVYLVDPVDLTLTHIDNSEEKPEEVEALSVINKNAYVLKINLALRDKSGDSVFSPEHHFKLDTAIDSIKVLSLVTEEDGSVVRHDVTDDFKCYQINEGVNSYKIIPLPMAKIDYIVTPSLYLALLNVPEDDGTYEFEVIVSLKDERILQQTSTLIALHTK